MGAGVSEPVSEGANAKKPRLGSIASRDTSWPLDQDSSSQGEGVLLFVSSLTRRNHHNRYPAPEWVHRQVYLNPYPKELMMRNHV